MNSEKSAPIENPGTTNTHQNIPGITLPKGGGTIAATGEKFQSNPVTGSAQTTIPVPISPGRAGFQPNLALNYDSGNGNGCFGIGWSIGLPAIQRKTSRDIPRYRPDDVFQLAGAEDLVPMYQRASQGTDYHPFRYPSADGLYQIVRYRPRIEGNFSKIEQWTLRSSGEVHWQLTGSDNTTTVYGQNPTARIADPEDESKIFSWLPEFTYNAHGHLIRYAYKQEDLAGIPQSLHEQHRQEGLQTPSNTYLKAIYYGNTLPYSGQPDFDANNTWLFQLVLDYGEHDQMEPSPQEVREWPLRKDPFSVYRAGFEQRTYRLCKRILMFHTFTELGPEPCLVKATELTYDENEIASRLMAATPVHYEKQGNTYTRATSPPFTFQYTEARIDESIQLLEVEAGWEMQDKLYEWTDLFGEGLPGMLKREQGSWFYRRNQGDGNLGACEAVSSHPVLAEHPSGRASLNDLAANGQSDLLAREPSLQGYHEMGTEEIWAPFKPFSALPNINWQDPNLRMLDLSGNGLPDIAITEQDCIRVYYSEGKEGYFKSEAAIRALDEKRGPQVIFADADLSVYTADMSGDGLSDILRIRNGEIAYWPNLGYGRFGAKVTMSSSPHFGQHDHFDPNRIRLADIDGSGTTDIMYLGPGGPEFWLNQSGNSWSDGRVLSQ
ncbi:MAG: SpvB/TcaC N-terminal domain-containing protein, partial [Bacteroidota bacterium]